MIYLLFLLLYFISIVTEKNDSKGANIGRIFVAVLYILLVGLRGKNVGKDTEVYIEHYYTFGKYGCDFIEPGFDFINRFCYSQEWLAFSYMLICASLAIIPVCFYLFKLKHREYTIASFLFYTVAFVILCNGMRQCIAVGIIFAVFFYIHEHQLEKRAILIYIGGIVFASLFHVSALFLLPVILLKKVELSNKLSVLIYLISFLFVFVDFSPYIPSLDVDLGNRDYNNYFDDMRRSERSLFGFIAVTFLNISILVLMVKKDLFENFKFIANLVLVYLVLVNVGYHILMVPRLNLYFSWFVYFVIARSFSFKERNLNMLSLKWVILFMYVVLIVNTFLSPSNKLLPYSFFGEW